VQLLLNKISSLTKKEFAMESALGLGQLNPFGVLGGAMMNTPHPAEKLRLVEVLNQTSGALAELEKLLLQIQQGLSGPKVMATGGEKRAEPMGSLHIAHSNRNDVHRLQNLAQAILSDL
jgi:hypothetical protein